MLKVYLRHRGTVGVGDDGWEVIGVDPAAESRVVRYTSPAFLADAEEAYKIRDLLRYAAEENGQEDPEALDRLVIGCLS